MCMGSSMLPIWGICPVKKGRTSPRARNMADRVMVFSCLFTMMFSLYLCFVPQGKPGGLESLQYLRYYYNTGKEKAQMPCRNNLPYSLCMAGQAASGR